MTRFGSKKQSQYHCPLNSQFLCEQTKFRLCIFFVSLFCLRGIASLRLNTGNTLVWSELIPDWVSTSMLRSWICLSGGEQMLKTVTGVPARTSLTPRYPPCRDQLDRISQFLRRYVVSHQGQQSFLWLVFSVLSKHLVTPYEKAMRARQVCLLNAVHVDRFVFQDVL